MTTLKEVSVTVKGMGSASGSWNKNQKNKIRRKVDSKYPNWRYIAIKRQKTKGKKVTFDVLVVKRTKTRSKVSRL